MKQIKTITFLLSLTFSVLFTGQAFSSLSYGIPGEDYDGFLPYTTDDEVIGYLPCNRFDVVYCQKIIDPYYQVGEIIRLPDRRFILKKKQVSELSVFEEGPLPPVIVQPKPNDQVSSDGRGGTVYQPNDPVYEVSELLIPGNKQWDEPILPKVDTE